MLLTRSALNNNHKEINKNNKPAKEARSPDIGIIVKGTNEDNTQNDKPKNKNKTDKNNITFFFITLSPIFIFKKTKQLEYLRYKNTSCQFISNQVVLAKRQSEQNNHPDTQFLKVLRGAILPVKDLFLRHFLPFHNANAVRLTTRWNQLSQ